MFPNIPSRNVAEMQLRVIRAWPRARIQTVGPFIPEADNAAAPPPRVRFARRSGVAIGPCVGREELPEQLPAIISAAEITAADSNFTTPGSASFPRPPPAAPPPARRTRGGGPPPAEFR